MVIFCYYKGGNWVCRDNLRMTMIPIRLYVPLEYEFPLHLHIFSIIEFSSYYLNLVGIARKLGLSIGPATRWKERTSSNGHMRTVYSLCSAEFCNRERCICTRTWTFLAVSFWVVFLQDVIREALALAFIPSATSPHIGLLLLFVELWDGFFPLQHCWDLKFH